MNPDHQLFEEMNGRLNEKIDKWEDSVELFSWEHILCAVQQSYDSLIEIQPTNNNNRGDDENVEETNDTSNTASTTTTTTTTTTNNQNTRENDNNSNNSKNKKNNDNNSNDSDFDESKFEEYFFQSLNNDHHKKKKLNYIRKSFLDVSYPNLSSFY